MTFEQESFDSDRDYIGSSRLLNRIVRRIEEQALRCAACETIFSEPTSAKRQCSYSKKVPLHDSRFFILSPESRKAPPLFSHPRRSGSLCRVAAGPRLKPLSVQGNLRQVRHFFGT